MKRGELCEYPNHPPTSVERTHLNQPALQTAGARVDRGICGIQALAFVLKPNLL